MSDSCSDLNKQANDDFVNYQIALQMPYLLFGIRLNIEDRYGAVGKEPVEVLRILAEAVVASRTENPS